MATRTAGDPAQRELSYRKRLIEIANMINSAASIQDILVEIKDKILDLVDAERVTIFALDTQNQELFSLFKAGQEVKEIRVAKSFASIAGFTALSRKTVEHQERLRRRELARLHPNLRFDQRWDKTSGFRTAEVLSTPILFEKYLLGVLQLVNKRGGGTAFTPKDEEAAEELAKILGIAFYNQHRAARTNKPSKFGGLLDKGLISEKDIEKAMANARVNQIDVAKVLEEDFKIPKEEIGRALSSFYDGAFWEPQGRTIPEDLKNRLSLDFLKKNLCRPGGAEGGDALRGGGGSLRPDPPRRHQGHEPRAAPRVHGGAQGRHPRLPEGELRRHVPGDRRAGHGPDHHGARDGRGGRGRGQERSGAARDRRDGQRDREARQPDHHRRLQQGRLRHPRRALRQGAPHHGALPRGRRLPEVPGDPAHRTATRSCSASRSWRSSTSPRSASPRTARSASRGPIGHDRAARRHHPDRRTATRTW